MKIVPAKFRFKPNEENFKFSKIQLETIQIGEIEVSDEQTGEKRWQIPTHDYTPGADSYNQIAFKLELDNGDSYKKEDLKLSINDSVRADGKIKWNDLVEDNESSWWYQNTSYKTSVQNGNTVYTPNRGDVDCITAAGVFRVFVKVKNTDKIIYTSPWIYVLPSGVTVNEYLVMLNDLISLHDAFVTRSNSAVGIGEAVDDLEEWVTRMKHVLGRIERNPAVNLEKCYTKTPVHKLHKFDSRVFRDYMRSGGAGKTASIDYTESLDVYENRVIKTFLERLKNSYDSINTYYKPEKAPKMTLSPPIASNTQQGRYKYLGTTIKDPLCEQTNLEKKTLKLFVSKKDPSKLGKICFYHKNRFYKIFTNELNDLSNRTPDSPYVPFHKQGTVPSSWAIEYYTSNKEEALRFCTILCKLFTASNEQEDWMEVECAMRINNSYNYVTAQGTYEIISGIPNTNNDYNSIYKIEDAYSEQLKKNGYNFDIRDPDYEKEFLERSAKIRSDYNNTCTQDCTKYNDAFEKAKLLLDYSKWINGIPSESSLTFPPSKTPKFARDYNYREIYDLMAKMVNTHYILSGHLDVNAFGVRDTHEIYEYWIFYKILSRLIELGFNPDKPESGEALAAETIQKNIFDQFVREGGISHKDFQIRLCKNINGEYLRIVFYYNHEFKNIHNEKKRTPDYAIFFPDNGHWYFFDAKYKKFSETHQKKEVRDVAAKKYVEDMECFSLIPKRPEDPPPKIMGSYLIVAEPCVSESTTDGLKMFSRLLDIEYLTNGETRLYGEELKSAVTDCGPHPIGMVQLTPGNETAFNALFKLIFEYKEQSCNVCWECGSTNISKKTLLTMSGAEKYYVTCKDCGEFRVETHCDVPGQNHILIKHEFDSYHMPLKTKDNTLTNWHVKCPYPHD